MSSEAGEATPGKNKLQRQRPARETQEPPGGNLPQGAQSVAGDRQRSPTGHEGMPASVPQPEMELHHGPQESPQSHR